MQTRFEQLLVWQKAHTAVIGIYQITATWPSTEQFGLVSQIRRAAVSVAANIAEGQLRSSQKDFKRFLAISRGSMAEVEYYLILTKDLGYITEETCTTFREMAQEIIRLLSRMILAIKDE